MKFIHLSDLHIGKRVNEFSMIEDQVHILKEIIGIIKEVSPDGVIIAGDVYDKPIPSAEAVRLFDDFVFELSRLSLEVFIISGNHDSPERIAFGSRVMEAGGIHLSPVFDGNIVPAVMRDEHGEVKVYMLPFIKPAHARRCFPEKEVESYTDAVRAAVESMNVDTSVRNIIVTHQFVTGASVCESEELSVGGTDNVDACVFDDFDYVALGHIHGPQHVSRPTVRYCGTPLKYSFSEASHKKSVTVVELGAKGDVKIDTIPLVPLRDMREIRGSYMEVTARDFYKDTDTEDYIRVTLTDEEDIPDAIGKLRCIYPNIMRLDYDNHRTRAAFSLEVGAECENKSPYQLFMEFYELQNGLPMSEEQQRYVLSLMESIWESQN